MEPMKAAMGLEAPEKPVKKGMGWPLKILIGLAGFVVLVVFVAMVAYLGMGRGAH